jgi:hypothetical protein
MSIDDATPAEWDRLKRDYPAITKRYEEMVSEEQGGSHTETDMVNHPDHYSGKIECIEAIEESMTPEAFNGYCKGNCLKYLWRYERKGKSLEDLQKAEWYLKRLVSSYQSQ